MGDPKFERYLIRLDPETEDGPEPLIPNQQGRYWRQVRLPNCYRVLAYLSPDRVLIDVAGFLIGRVTSARSIKGDSNHFDSVWLITALSFAQKAIMAGHWSPCPGLFWVHLVFLGGVSLAIGLGSFARGTGGL